MLLPSATTAIDRGGNPMSSESESAERESVEARWVPYSWWLEALIAIFMLAFGLLVAGYMRVEFPDTPLVALIALALFWLTGAYTLYRRARGLTGRYLCPGCGATVGGGGSRGRLAFAKTDCSRCGAHITYPTQG
jgi:hypothetical protein